MVIWGLVVAVGNIVAIGNIGAVETTCTVSVVQVVRTAGVTATLYILYGWPKTTNTSTSLPMSI